MNCSGLRPEPGFVSVEGMVRLVEVQLVAPALEKFSGAGGIIVPLFARQTPADEDAKEQSSTENAEHGSPWIRPHVTLTGIQCLAGLFFRRFPSLRRALRGGLGGPQIGGGR